MSRKSSYLVSQSSYWSYFLLSTVVPIRQSSGSLVSHSSSRIPSLELLMGRVPIGVEFLSRQSSYLVIQCSYWSYLLLLVIVSMRKSFIWAQFLLLIFSSPKFLSRRVDIHHSSYRSYLLSVIVPINHSSYRP